MATFDFSWNKANDQNVSPATISSGPKLNDEILITNIRWFIIFRWGVIAALIAFEILATLSSETLIKFGIIDLKDWPISIILALSIANFAYAHALKHRELSLFHNPTINLWVQIVVDLVCLSVVVHFVGSTATPAPFFYVLHIVLACIFFSTRESLLVTFLVCAMYTFVLLFENPIFIQLPQSGVIDAHPSIESRQSNRVLLWMFVLNTLFFIIWYVVSRLSMVVREHEMRLLDAYRQINQTQVEKDQYAVLMTHQLKSPLDAIRSKINLIKAGYCGESSQETKDVLMKIDKRAKNMAGLILDLLRLERLKQTCIDCADTATLKPVDISGTLQKCIDKLKPVTKAKNVDIHVSIQNFAYHGIPDQLEILLENIISNAITYSFDGGPVEITSCIDQANETASLTITDHGIGIEGKDLPNIFNEYFYSPRAVTHNQASSGVGLSIVKKAAENNNLQIKVNSEPGQGTSFTVIFQHVQFPPDAIK